MWSRANGDDGIRFGIDIGGTFTDLVAMRRDHVIQVGKILTTPDDPSEAVARGVDALLAGIGAEDVTEVVHGTTLVPNALIERTGAVTALVTTAGFRDTLGIRREHRYDIYDLFIELPEPLVPRCRRWEVRERVLADGTIDTKLDTDDLRRVIDRVAAEGVESIAVCFLHSYRTPSHEHQAASLLRDWLPSVAISVSSDVVPEIGEYTRTSTTVANAYVQPLVEAYLVRLAERFHERSIDAPLHVMLSTGGLADVDLVRRYPVRITESGPAAGVISAAHSGLLAGFSNVLAFDMGGTTAKACLVEGGTPLVAQQHEVARMHRFAKGSGLPIQAPVVDLIEIGAGGGSIARVDAFGLPQVGPESAAAEPGPACYGRGGVSPTVTDGDLLLGYLDAEFFVGGTMALDRDAAESAIGSLMEKLDLTLEETAAGVHRVVNENMAAAARIHAIEHGRDLERYTLVATGGAGPVHAWGVARGLGISRIVFPPAAGVASAFGMLVAGPAFEFSRSMPSLISEISYDKVGAVLADMRREGGQALARLNVTPEDVVTTITVDMRYKGQGDTLAVEVGDHVPVEDPSDELTTAFEHAYTALFGRRPEGVQIEVVTWRLRVEGARGSSAASAASWPKPKSRAKALKGHREIWSEEERRMVDARVLDRYALSVGSIVEGPAILEERESSVVIGTGGVAIVDSNLNVVVEICDRPKA